MNKMGRKEVNDHKSSNTSVSSRPSPVEAPTNIRPNEGKSHRRWFSLRRMFQGIHGQRIMGPRKKKNPSLEMEPVTNVGGKNTPTKRDYPASEASYKSKRNTVKGYFLADKSIPFFAVGASLFVSNIGSEHFIGLAGSGAAGGIGVAAWEFNALFFIQLLGFVFVPVYIASKTFTMPEYTNKRFGGQRIRVYYALLSLFLYIFTKCSVNLYTGALFIQQALDWNLYLSILLQIGIVAVLTITGGLTAVIYTDTLQAVLMLAGALTLTGMGFREIGGIAELWRRYPLAIVNATVANTTCHEINPNWDVLLRHPSDPEMPWPGFLFGQSPASIWYWCADQVIVQRTLAAKNLSHAQGGSLMAGFLKLLPFFMMVLPGMISRVLFTEEVACVDPEKCMEICQSRTSCSNIAFPRLVLGIMPVGAKGLMLAVMLSALMSDLDSIFNSASTMFTIDIYQRIRKKAGKTELMITGRLFVIVMVGVAVAWVPVVQQTQGGQLFIYIQEISAYLAPPVACIFLLAILWPGCNEKGAFFGLITGLILGVVRLILIMVYAGPAFCGDEDSRPAFLSSIHYMYYAIFLFWVTALVAIFVSLVTKPPTLKQIYRTTFWTRYFTVKVDDIESGNYELEWKYLRCVCYVKPSKEQVEEMNTQAYVNLSYESNLDIHDSSQHDGKKQQENVKSDDVTKHPGNESKKTFSSANLTENELPYPNSVSKVKDFIYIWICGISSDSGFTNTYEVTRSEEELKMEKKKEAEEEDEEIKAALDQNRTAKVLLHLLLAVILGIAVFMFTFLSIFRWRP